MIVGATVDEDERTMVRWMSFHLIDVLMIALVFRHAPLEALYAVAAGFTLMYWCLNAVFAMP